MAELIPKVLHRVWIKQDDDDEIPPRFEAFWDRFQELHPDWIFRTWYELDDLEFHGTRPLYDQATTDAGRADVVRFVLMYQFGGVYVDTDYEPLRAFDPLLADASPFAGYEKDGLLCPTVLGGPPEHPAYRAVLDLLPRWAVKFPPSKPNLQTGPRPLTHAWRWRSDVRRLARETFYPVGWWERDRLGGPYPPESFGVHHWEQSWDPAARARIDAAQ